MFKSYFLLSYYDEIILELSKLIVRKFKDYEYTYDKAIFIIPKYIVARSSN